MKLWSASDTLNKKIEKFTIGRDLEFDQLLAEYDVIGSLAHAQMLEAVGLITVADLRALQLELRKIYRQIKEKGLQFAEGMEDVHSQIEYLLVEALGEPGKRIHAGRSRNDQILLDIKLFLRREIKNICLAIDKIFDLFVQASATHKDVLMPGYTHMQVAMPSSFGLWYAAYAENLIDDLRYWKVAYDISDCNPLGSGAGYGSSFPLNRQLTTKLLGFSDLNYNVIHAQMQRGRTELHAAYAMASTANSLGKFAADVCLYSSQNYDFISLPDEVVTGSSIMPHKRNPDVFELIAGKCNILQNLPSQITSLLINLPSGYHRDFQLLKELLFPAIYALKDCLDILNEVIPKIKAHPDLLKQEKYQAIFTVEEVARLVQQGLSFRDAYLKVSHEVKEGTFHFHGELKHTLLGSMGNLGLPEIKNKYQQVRQQFDFTQAESALSALLAND